MDWLIPLLFVIVSIALSSSSGKKKKREAEARRAQQSGRAEQARQMPQQKSGGYMGGNAAGKRPPHPYAESAKDKGMTLDDFRRKYESIGGGKSPQPAAKPGAANPQTAQPASAEPAPQRQTVRQSQPERAQTPETVTGQKARNMAEQRRQQQKAAAVKRPQQKKSVPVTSVDIGSQAKESPVMAGVMANKNDLHTEFGADAVAFVNSKNLSPMQQGLLWAEILGAPKAKRQRGGRF